MVINPFEIVKSSDISINKNKSENIDLNKIQQYIISNYIRYLQNDDREKLKLVIKDYIIKEYSITEKSEQENIENIILNKITGYDILQKYIEMEDVTDIRVVKYNQIYVKKKGIWIKVDISFLSSEKLEEFIRYCVLKNGTNINYDSPIIIVSDKKYNLRIEAGIDPVNSISPSLVIRIHRPDDNITLEKLFVVDEMLDNISYKCILSILKNEMNVVIAGKGGSGKTTLLRAILNKIPNNKAITINEETTEIYLTNKNVIQREVIENRNEIKKITLEKLMKHSLVMSNDILVCR